MNGFIHAWHYDCYSTPMVTWSKFKPVHIYVHIGISSRPISALWGALQSITYLSAAAPHCPQLTLPIFLLLLAWDPGAGWGMHPWDVIGEGKEIVTETSGTAVAKWHSHIFYLIFEVLSNANSSPNCGYVLRSTYIFYPWNKIANIFIMWYHTAPQLHISYF